MKKLILRTLPVMLLLVGAFIVLSGCEENKYPITVNFILIGKGVMNGNGTENVSPQNAVIANATEWQRLLSAMDSHNNISSSFSETNIDFEKFQLIVVIDSVRPVSSEINIKNITENKSDISVRIEKTSYDATVITQPFYIVKIRKTNKIINFTNL